MKMKATRFYLGSLLMLLLGSSLWVGCNYKYEDRYSYAKENASYLDAVKATAHAALLADSRVRAILDGTDVDAKAALQTLLDDMQNLQKDTDGVVYAALVESFLQNSSIVQADATKSIGVLATMMKASAAHDRNSAMAEGVRDDGKADAARSAMTAYAAQRDSETLKALLNTYYGAIAGDHASLASSAPIASAIIFAGSTRAVEGSDSITDTIEALKHANKTTVGDAAIENEKSGVELISLMVAQMQNALDAANTAGKDASFQQNMVLDVAHVIHHAGEGMAQVAAVVATRVQQSMIAAGQSQERIDAVMESMESTFERRQQIATQSRAAAGGQSDETLSNRVAGVIAELNQLISFVNDETKATEVAESTETLATTVSNAGGDATTIADALTTSNSTLSSTIGAGNGGGGGEGDNGGGSGGGGNNGGGGSGGGGGGNNGGGGSGGGSGYSIGGTVTGLVGSVTIRNNNQDDETISADGAFSFNSKIASGATYAVTVGDHPATQMCDVTNGSGTVAGANVTNVAVNCYAKKKLRISSSTVTAKMSGNPTNATEAMALADAVCVSNYGAGYKALIGSSVRLSTTGDWPLAANTYYVNYDATKVIGKTTNDKVFTFPLTNYVSGAGTMVWTGLKSDWTLSDYTCTDWTVTTGNGTAGKSNVTHSQAIAGGESACGLPGTINGLYCVEQ